MPVQISFTDPFPLPDGFRIGYRKKGTSDALTYVEDAGPSPITLNEVDNYQDYEGTLESVCSGFYSEAVGWATNEFTTVWSVTDTWFDCAPEPCDGAAIYCTYFTVRRVSDAFIVFSYGYDGTGPVRSGFMPTLEDGVSYELEAEWFADSDKTWGFGSVSLTGNGTTDIWVELLPGTATHSIVFMGVAGVNSVSVGVEGDGPSCSCV